MFLMLNDIVLMAKRTKIPFRFWKNLLERLSYAVLIKWIYGI